MTITDQIKVLDRKIMQNEARYDLDRKATKVSALSSNNLDKYEYVDKYEYSPLGKIFNKGLSEDDKKEGLFKRLKNIENAQKKFIKDDYNESICDISRSKFDDKDDKYKKNRKSNKIDTKTTKCLRLFKKFKSRGKRVDG